MRDLYIAMAENKYEDSEGYNTAEEDKKPAEAEKKGTDKNEGIVDM